MNHSRDEAAEAEELQGHLGTDAGRVVSQVHQRATGGGVEQCASEGDTPVPDCSVGTVNALEWTEIQIASDLSSNVFGDCIAHLVAGSLIDSSVQRPGMLGRMSGKEEKFFFWATERGSKFLADQSEKKRLKRLFHHHLPRPRAQI